MYTQIMNESRFNLAYPIPSVSAAAAQFQPVFTVDLMWRGFLYCTLFFSRCRPTWPILTWFVMEGLQRHGYTEEMEPLITKWVDLYNLSGVWEQYNPLNGDPYGLFNV